MLASYYSPLWTLYVTEGISGAIIGYKGFKHLEDTVYNVMGTVFLGANLIATSIALLAQLTMYEALAIQALVIIIFGIAGIIVQCSKGYA